MAKPKRQPTKTFDSKPCKPKRAPSKAPTTTQIDTYAVHAAASALLAGRDMEAERAKQEIVKLRDDWRSQCLRQLRSTKRGRDFVEQRKRVAKDQDPFHAITFDDWISQRGKPTLEVAIETKWGVATYYMGATAPLVKLRDKLDKAEQVMRRCHEVLHANRYQTLSIRLRAKMKKPEAAKSRGIILREMNKLLEMD